jgi:hypothetical protein
MGKEEEDGLVGVSEKNPFLFDYLTSFLNELFVNTLGEPECLKIYNII